jgi:hypothetical protein
MANITLAQMVYQAFSQATFGNIIILDFFVLLMVGVIIWRFKLPSAASFMVGFLAVYAIAIVNVKFDVILSILITVVMALLAFVFIRIGRSIGS